MFPHSLVRVTAAAIVCIASAHAQIASPHPVRPPFALETTPIAAEQYAIASAGETSLVVYREAFLAGRILGKRSDGRGLQGAWSAVAVVSSEDTTPRLLHRDSVQVVGDVGFCVWLEDDGSANHTRLFSNRFVVGAWQTPARVNDAFVPASHDILDFACAARTGLNGSMYVAIVFATSDVTTHTIALYCVISPNGGQSFNPPFALASAGFVPGGSATAIGGVAVDLKGGELHVAWTDDRNDPGNDREVFYRRALLDWFGTPIFTAPLGTGSSDRQMSFTDDVAGAPVIAVDDDPYAPGGFSKDVGIGWRELDKGQNLPTLYVRASHDSGTNFLLEHAVAHTATAGDAVVDFDLEILGGRYIATFEDNALDIGGNSVFIFPPGLQQVWRAISPDGTDFSATGEGIVTMLSGFVEPSAHGHSPLIARAAGVVDAGLIAWLEDGSKGPEVRTAFSDQLGGGAFHLDDEPEVSKAQSGSQVRELKRPRAAYNARYSNFLIVWQQEIMPDTGVFQLLLGGYRPQQVEVVGWNVGSAELYFRLRHLPFSDSFAFVLISAGASPDPSVGFVLPDGRRTGLLPDVFQQIGLANFMLFLAQNDPVIEGASTLPIPLPPGFITPGIGLSCTGVTWGIGGALHVVTDFVQTQS